MKSLQKTIKDSHFTIFLLVVLIIAVIIVSQINHTVNQTFNNTNNSTSTNSTAAANTPGDFNVVTANKLRAMASSAEVSQAPDLGTEGRINPFAE